MRVVPLNRAERIWIWGTFYILYDGEVRVVVFAPPLGLVVVDSSADVALKKKQER